MLPFKLYTDLQPWQSVKGFSNKIRVPGGWWLMAISQRTFYGDESGSHGDGPFVMSGYLATDHTWGQLENQWHEVLQDSTIGGRPIGHFRMRECFKLEGQFEGMRRHEADKKLNALVDVIRPFTRSRALHEFTSILDWDVFNRAVSGPLREEFHNPYIFTFGAIMTESGRYLKDELKESDSIYFFMDDQTTKVESTVAYHFNLAKRSVLTGLGEYFDAVTFIDDRYCYPLQAADLIAWQRHRRELNLSVDRGEMLAYKRLMAATPSDVPVLFPYMEPGLKSFSERVESTIRRDREIGLRDG